MKRLRLLKVLCFLDCHHLSYLSNELRLLDWKDCPLISLPSSFQPHNLVALLLPYSRIKQLWKGTIPMDKLKLINLEGSQHLIETPDFAMAPNLEILNLKGCSNLISLPSGIGGCKSLKTLNLSGCYKIENLPESLQQAELLEELDLSETAITKPPSFIFEMKNLKVLSFDGCKGPPSNLWRNLAFGFFGRTNSMTLMIPSLSGLSSLTKLKLKDCNLFEGDIPSDISSLASLKILDLGGNNFISIPWSFTQLSNLEELGLSNCKQLKSLPEVLTVIRFVNIYGCASLELIANPSKVYYSRDWACVFGLHCYRLAEKMNALTLLKRYIKVLANSRREIDMVLPGSEIPEWFHHKRDGSSIKIRLPFNIRNDSECMGVALCGIFVNRDASRDEFLSCKAVINNRGNVERGFNFKKPYNQPIIKDHLFFSLFVA